MFKAINFIFGDFLAFLYFSECFLDVKEIQSCHKVDKTQRYFSVPLYFSGEKKLMEMNTR